VSTDESSERVISEPATGASGRLSQGCNCSGRIAELIHAKTTEFERSYPRTSVTRMLRKKALIQLGRPGCISKISLGAGFGKKIAHSGLFRRCHLGGHMCWGIFSVHRSFDSLSRGLHFFGGHPHRPGFTSAQTLDDAIRTLHFDNTFRDVDCHLFFGTESHPLHRKRRSDDSHCDITR
jgi:hypothetical protein